MTRLSAMFVLAVVALSAVGASGYDKLPKITAQPQGVTRPPGGEAVLFARAYGAGELAFQWLRNEVPLPKANEPVLRLTSLSAAQAGDYRVTVANSYGRATSEVARVSVDAAEAGAWLPAVVSCNARLAGGGLTIRARTEEQPDWFGTLESCVSGRPSCGSRLRRVAAFGSHEPVFPAAPAGGGGVRLGQ
jgi:hypothetical protein